MPRIRPFRAEDVLQIELRASDYKNLEGIDFVAHGKELALTPYASTLLTDDGYIIACLGGFVFGKTSMVFLLTSTLLELYPLVTLKVSKAYFARAMRHGVVRFETLVNPDDARAVRFIEYLGFEREGLCRATGYNLMDRYLYARICLPDEER